MPRLARHLCPSAGRIAVESVGLEGSSSGAETPKS
jgi:hypothetical protein